MKKYKIIIDFFKMIGAKREAERYLKLFHRGNPARLAVIRLGGATVENAKDLIAIDLAYISRLDLYPVVIHGGGPQIDKALSEAGMRYRKIDGLRVTTKKQLPIIKKVLDKVNAEIVNEIHKFDGKAIGITEGVFVAKKHPDERLGYAGIVKKVNIEPILRAIKNKKIPVVSCLGFGEDGSIYNVNADVAAKSAVLAVKPKKYILITEEGGVKSANNRLISHINLTEELPVMEKNGIIKGGMLLKVREAKSLLDNARFKLTVQITSSGRLLKELFTDKGSGTLIKLGSEILELSGWDGVNKSKVRHIVENSFGRPLKPDYFDKPVSNIFLDSKYKGVAVIRKVEDMYYMDKFCVAGSAQGEGVASDIWFRIIKKCPNLFWRSRVGNPVNGWYFEKSSGAIKSEKWVFFWINISEEQRKKAIDYTLNLEETLLPSQLAVAEPVKA